MFQQLQFWATIPVLARFRQVSVFCDKTSLTLSEWHFFRAQLCDPAEWVLFLDGVGCEKNLFQK
ncbi:hypothetical protein AZI86_10110 [Bdellovibrio bacteriovorus]|uniref:Uncharacterized protein n=1 Tax=Bdellovibrio bacteriovorus TaxID=959 RepID=A0A150WSC7_BDEBC|nr:hypothetical protein AZI86_10110 [Bdellovibrio bacteriovorus]